MNRRVLAIALLFRVGKLPCEGLNGRKRARLPQLRTESSHLNHK